MSETNDSWTQLRCGSVVVRELPTQDWLVSWYPNEGDPNYPGFTISLAEKGVAGDSPQQAVEWAKSQEWTRYCEGDAGVVVGVGVPSAEEVYLPAAAKELDVPAEEWTVLREKAAEFGWLIAATHEPDGRYSWAVYDSQRSELMQSGTADDWDEARLSMIENLYPPSGEK
jgi:hypothetical protein